MVRKGAKPYIKDADEFTCFCLPDENGKICDENCVNRALHMECGSQCSLEDNCQNKRFQKFQYSPIEQFYTGPKGWGIRAKSPIYKHDFIIEYIGEIITSKSVERRMKQYKKEKIPHHYLMELGHGVVIDATKYGNLSRFLNHSCDPNAVTQKWLVNKEIRIGIFALKDIDVGEEIVFDYAFERFGNAAAQKCFCNSLNCAGYIGDKPKKLNASNDLMVPIKIELPDTPLIMSESSPIDTNSSESEIATLSCLSKPASSCLLSLCTDVSKSFDDLTMPIEIDVSPSDMKSSASNEISTTTIISNISKSASSCRLSLCTDVSKSLDDLTMPIEIEFSPTDMKPSASKEISTTTMISNISKPASFTLSSLRSTLLKASNCLAVPIKVEPSPTDMKSSILTTTMVSTNSFASDHQRGTKSKATLSFMGFASLKNGCCIRIGFPSQPKMFHQYGLYNLPGLVVLSSKNVAAFTKSLSNQPKKSIISTPKQETILCNHVQKNEDKNISRCSLTYYAKNPEWIETCNDEGIIYYYHEKTRKSRWEEPPEKKLKKK